VGPHVAAAAQQQQPAANKQQQQQQAAASSKQQQQQQQQQQRGIGSGNGCDRGRTDDSAFISSDHPKQGRDIDAVGPFLGLAAMGTHRVAPASRRPAVSYQKPIKIVVIDIFNSMSTCLDCSRVTFGPV
jgi:hypothetical protein